MQADTDRTRAKNQQTQEEDVDREADDWAKRVRPKVRQKDKVKRYREMARTKWGCRFVGVEQNLTHVRLSSGVS